MITMTKRFYVTNHSVENENLMMTYSEAVEKAKSRIQNGTEATSIVEVVAVVRREEVPVVIEKVRR